MTRFGQELLSYQREGEGSIAFATRLGCDQSYVSKLVNAKRRPSIGFIDDVAERLDLSKRQRDRLVVLAFDVGDRS